MKTIQDIINDSGYPLQLLIEDEIKKTLEQHYWRVLVREHRWVNSESHEEGFIDLILENTRYKVRLVVECKRIIGSWNFLVPTVNPVPVRRVRLLHAHYDSHSFTWEELPTIPESCESAYCVMTVNGNKDNRTLEKLSGGLLLSLEYLALEEINLKPKPQYAWGDMFYLPVIVTTANLQRSLFTPSDVNINDGKIISSSLEDVQFIRFRKNLATSREYNKETVTNIREANQENDRTVFVVQAKDFINYLTLSKYI